MVKNEKHIWRIIAIICTLVWIIVLFAVNAFVLAKADRGTFTLLHNNLLYGFSIVISLALIFFPMQFYLYATMFWVWGLLRLADGGGGGINGILMYLLGCAFAYKQGFFVKHTKVKYFILLFILFTHSFHYRLGVNVLTARMLDFLFVAMFFTLIYFLIIHPLVEKIKTPPSNSIIIAKCHLTEEELGLLDAVLHEEPYKAIGSDTGISESLVKQRVSVILEKTGVANRGYLLALYKQGKVIFPN